jgi:hypothetical protein
MNSLDYLLLLLEEVKRSVWDIPLYRGESKQNHYFDPEHAAIYHASKAATDYLFDKRGLLVMQAKQELLRAGYNTVFIEKDKEFGWLTVGITITVKEKTVGTMLVYNETIWNTIERFGTIKREEN